MCCPQPKVKLDEKHPVASGTVDVHLLPIVYSFFFICVHAYLFPVTLCMPLLVFSLILLVLEVSV